MASAGAARPRDAPRAASPHSQHAAASFKPQLCLGDAATYEAWVAAEAAGRRAPPPPPDAVWLASLDRSTIPGEVWAAADLLGDRGAPLVRTYLELAADR